MKGKAIIPLVLGLCIGLVAIKLVVDTVKKAQASGKPKETVTVVRAAADINVGAEFVPELLEEVEVIPSGLVPANERVGSISDLEGRVAMKTIPQGSAVLKTMLAPEGTKPGMVARVPPGYRAFSVPISETSAVAFQFRPGDWVDVIVVMDIRSDGRKTETISEVILQNIQVIAVGRSQSSRATTVSRYICSRVSGVRHRNSRNASPAYLVSAKKAGRAATHRMVTAQPENCSSIAP